MTDAPEEPSGPPLSEEDVKQTFPLFGQKDVQQHQLDLAHQAADRDRGFLTERDRLYLLRKDLKDHQERRARMDIRNRLLNAYFDLRHLPYLSSIDRQQLFEQAAEDWDLHLRNSIKEFVKFTLRGIVECHISQSNHTQKEGTPSGVPEPMDADDYVSILQDATKEAMEEAAIADGQLFIGEVNFSLTTARRSDITELEERYEQGKPLSPDQLNALINNEYTDIDLVDALVHQSRQLEGTATRHGPHNYYKYQNHSPDAAKAEEIEQDLREYCKEFGIEDGDLHDFEFHWHRLLEDQGSFSHPFHECVRNLDKTTPYFPQQLAEITSLSEQDMENLHRILWDPQAESVERIIRDMAKPDMAGGDWVPAHSQTLKKFIARVEVAKRTKTRFGNALFTMGDGEGQERWNRLRELAEFDEEEWSGYMQEQLVKSCVTELKEWIEEDDLDTTLIHQAESWEDYWHNLPKSKAQHFHHLVMEYGEDTMEEALESLRNALDS